MKYGSELTKVITIHTKPQRPTRDTATICPAELRRSSFFTAQGINAVLDTSRIVLPNLAVVMRLSDNPVLSRNVVIFELRESGEK